MILDPGAFIDRRALQSDGLTQFPLSYSGSVYTLADSAADLRLAAQAESKKNDAGGCAGNKIRPAVDSRWHGRRDYRHGETAAVLTPPRMGLR